MPQSIEIMRIEADINKFLWRSRSAYRRFTRVNLCYLQHIERALYNKLISNNKSLDLLMKSMNMFTKILQELSLLNYIL